jgi:spermidine synthase
VEIRTGDVADVIGEVEDGFDLVLLDVDNGPAYLVHETNSALYGPALLRTTRRAMRPHGLCVIWSAARDQALHDAMAEVFGDAEATAYDVDLQGRAEQYWLHLARVPSTA